MKKTINNNSRALQREEILKGFLYEDSGGIRSFNKLPLEQINLLIKNKFLDIEEYEFYNFMQLYPGTEAIGWIRTRDAEEMHLEGIILKVATKDLTIPLLLDFIKFRNADEFNVYENDGEYILRCWYD